MLIQAAACACYSDLATQEDTGPLVHGATRVWWPLHLAIFNILNISECNVHNITKTPVHAIKNIYCDGKKWQINRTGVALYHLSEDQSNLAYSLFHAHFHTE